MTNKPINIDAVYPGAEDWIKGPDGDTSSTGEKIVGKVHRSKEDDLEREARLLSEAAQKIVSQTESRKQK